MRNFFALCLFGAFMVCSLLSSCGSNSGKQFSSKQDSLSFAQAVMEKYQGEKVPASPDTIFPLGPAKGRSFKAGGMEPIDWETVLLYQSNYDKDPQLKAPQGYYYQGYSIDAAAYNTLLQTPSIKGLYLRLGKKDDGAYTIMILGTDANGKIISGANSSANRDSTGQTNFDNIPSCPQDCPMEPGN